jgi:hypothetical protein
MNDKLLSSLEASGHIRSPLPFDYGDTAEARLAAKQAIKQRPLNITDSTAGWETVGNYAQLDVSSDYSDDGRGSLRFTSPTRISTWEHDYARIYATPSILYRFDREDWTEYNRLSFWVRPELPGFKFVSLHLQIINEGEHPVPDFYHREGCHNMNLVNHEWNRVTLEIPNIDRDCVTGLYYGYDIIGHENEAAKTAQFYIRDIELEIVAEPDPYKGWEVAAGRISFSGSGYQTGSSKTAIVNRIPSDTFKLVHTNTGKVAVEKQINWIHGELGEFGVLDFSEVREPGVYLLVVGDIVSRVFPIGDDVWKDGVWKTINLFFCERCGFEVPGIHKYCHGNVVSRHGDKSVVANGGWHDAADMSQNLTNTAEATYALFEAALRFQDDEPLFKRLVEEGKWGLEWMLKTRFGDGFRTMGSGTSVWTSGILGGEDVIVSDAQDLAIENFMAAGAEALAARVLREIDPQQSAYLVQVAGEDWRFAYANIDQEQYVEAMDPARVSSPLLLYAAGCWAACDIFEATGDAFFQGKAIELATRIVACQQKEVPVWKIPLTGFFYRDTNRKIIQHYNHRSHEHEPILALTKVCELFAGHPDWILWYHAVLLHSEYLMQISAFTEPYGVSPASIYHENEAIDDPDLFLKQQPHAEQQMFDDYREQVRGGIELGQGYYLRRMPVWFSFRGNNGILLANGEAAALAAGLRNEPHLTDLAHRQLEWIVGKNPFAQSLMFGEGYDYAQQYVCLPGEITGSLCVGIQSFRNEDVPYWPHANNAVYREMWVHPSIRYLLLASRISGSARITGYMRWAEGEWVQFTHRSTGQKYRAKPEYRTGKFELELSAGSYEIQYRDQKRLMTFVSGQKYELTDPFKSIDVSYDRQAGQVTMRITTSGTEAVKASLLSDNLSLIWNHIEIRPNTPEFVTAQIDNEDQAWLALIIPEGQLANKVEIYGGKP